MGKSKRAALPPPSSSKKKKKISPMIDFLAGSYSGIMATVVGHPFDTVRNVRSSVSFPITHTHITHHTHTHIHINRTSHTHTHTKFRLKYGCKHRIIV